MVMKIKLIIALALAIVLLIVIVVPAPADSPSLADTILNPAGGSLEQNPGTAGGSAEAPPVVAQQWYFVMLTDVTGMNAEEGVAAAWGFDYGVKAINETGGVRGVDVRSATRDTASEASKAASEMATVAGGSDVDGNALLVLGPVLAAEYDAAADVFADAHIPAIGYAANEETIRKDAPYAISSAAAPGEAAGKAVTAWISKDAGIQKIAMIYDSSIYSINGNAERVKQVIADAGLTLTVTVETSGDVFDAAGVAEAAFGTGANAFYIDLAGDGNRRVAEQLAHLNGDSVPSLLMGSLAVDFAQFSDVSALTSEKVFFWSEYDPGLDTEKRQAFNAAFTAAIGSNHYYNIAVNYCQAARFAAQAIEELGLTGDPARLSEEREKLAIYLHDCAQVRTPLGNFATENGYKLVEPALYSIKDGKFVQVIEG
jgi:ABC-type branched-subunit amino acid transport system substrate-binding protein